MLKVYGSKLCPDCQEMEKAFKAEKIEYEYYDITSDLRNLKAFLALRDSNEKFAKAKEKGLIGIPVVSAEEGVWTFHWQDFLSKPVAESSCSDGVCGMPR